MQTRTIIIGNSHGLHMRVAAKIAQLAKEYRTRIRLFGRDNRQADGSSVLELLTLGAEKGSPVRVEIDGPSEDAVAAGLEVLFSDGAGI